MEREIKFQFIVDNNKLSQAYTIDEILKIDESLILEVMEECNCPTNESINHCEGDCLKYQNSTITGKRQFTGLKDKSGKEIYEGDLFNDVLKSNKNGIVKLGEYKHCFDKSEISFGGHIGFYVDWGDSGLSPRKDLKFWSNHSEVIGNIYMNPDLIKQ